jgi:ABC-type Na+ efflux pump permease subunit
MVSEIGSSPASNAVATTVTSNAGIEAQIARDKKELSNCVNCESAETKQGQADIQTLTNKISAAQARLDAIRTTEQISQPAELDSTNASDSATSLNTASSIAENKTSGESAPTLNSPETLESSDSSTGRFVDEFV